jgi:hypothetical protein
MRPSEPLHVAVVVLGSPHVTALPLERGRDHVIDQSVLVGDTRLGERCSELLVEDLLEEILEAAVVRLQNRVLGGEVDRVLAVQAIAQ